jgi:hypothetical protein
MAKRRSNTIASGQALPSSAWTANGWLMWLGVGNQRFVVVNGKEEKPYDDIVTIGGGKIVFDSADSLHYLALIRR